MMKCTDAFEYDQEFEIFKISKVKKRSVFFRSETRTINLYSQSIENNYWITIQNYQIILNHFKFARFT